MDVDTNPYNIPNIVMVGTITYANNCTVLNPFSILRSLACFHTASTSSAHNLVASGRFVYLFHLPNPLHLPSGKLHYSLNM